jgi:hypothetical protein
MSNEITIRDRIVMAMPYLVLPTLIIVGLFFFGSSVASIINKPSFTTIVNVISPLIIGGILIWLGKELFRICLKNIPAKPPNVGIVTIHGERKPIIKREGWHLLWPRFPFWYDVVLVNIEKKNKDFRPKDVRSKERAELDVEVSITYAPDSKNAENLIQYLNSGGKEVIENILDDIIEEGTIDFAADKTWRSLFQSATREKLLLALVKKLTGKTEQELAGKIEEIRRGNGVEEIPYLGIILNRLNIGMRRIKGRLAEEAERPAIEKTQRKAEKTELDHVRERIKEIRKTLGVSPEAAIELVQTERGKVSKQIIEYKGLEKFKGLPLITIGGERMPRGEKEKRTSREGSLTEEEKRRIREEIRKKKK